VQSPVTPDVGGQRSLSIVVAGLDNHNPVADVVHLCVGVPIAVVLELLFRRSFLWWCASTLAVLAIVLSVSIATLDKLGFK
jgi:hypothetical protein